MKRLVMMLLLALLVILTVPGLREEATPHFQAGAAWAGEMLQGPLSPALRPYRELQTQSEMSRVLNILVGRRNRGIDPVSTDDLPWLMRQMDLDSTATDAWGSSYDIRQTPDSLFLRSPGPDLSADTEDDIILGIRYRAPARRRGLRR